MTDEAHGAERSQEEREQGEAIAERVGDDDQQRLQRAGHGEALQRGRALRAHGGVERAADGDAEQGDDQDEAEGVARAAEQRPQHAVPDQLEEEEGEADDARGGEDEEARRGCRRSRDGGLLLGGRGRAAGGGHGRQRARVGAGDDRHQGVDQAGHPQGEADAEDLEEQERRGERSEHRAERVGAVEERHRAPPPVAGLLHGARGRRQGAAHQDGGTGEDQRGKEQARHRAAEGAEHRRASDGDVDGPHQPHQRRGDGRAERQAELEVRVHAQRPFGAVDAAAEPGAAHAQPAHEDGEHGGVGRGRGAEDQTQLAQPRDLIDERARPGPEQQGRDL
ncbi:MAG: hypothetical protein WKG00_40265 [Polyangiaceae bacterium]